MKKELYQWIKNIAVFYILFTTVLHLVPDKKYERYIRSFMGLLLIYMLCRPVFAVLGNGTELFENFGTVFQEEQQLMNEAEAEKLQAFYLKKGYEEALTLEISRTLKKNGINITDIAVHIEGEEITVVLTAGQKLTEEQKGGIRDELRKGFGITEKNCQIFTGKSDGKTVDDASSAGTSPDCDRSSRTGQESRKQKR